MRVVRIIVLVLVGFASAAAKQPSDTVYRNFWHPCHDRVRLNYCLQDGKTCGLPVAARYCHRMGYAQVARQIIDHNVGITRYLPEPNQEKCTFFCMDRLRLFHLRRDYHAPKCKGIQCNGFKLIECTNTFSHKPARPYYYRLRRYVHPEYHRYPLDWCYDGTHQCGKRAAQSFCRRKGFREAKQYHKAPFPHATLAIGNSKLCLNHHCHTFTEIICYR